VSLAALSLELGPAVQLHSRRETGDLLLILGILLLVGGSAASSYCGVGFLGACVTFPYLDPGIALGLLGFLLLAVGLYLRYGIPTPPAAPHHLIYQPHAQPYPAISPLFLRPPAAYSPTPAPLATMRAERYCGACGEPNLRLSVFCHRCGTMLQPVT
jgi:hypothetical protein